MPSGKPIVKSLAEYKPALAKEWHPSKNGSFSPSDVSPRSKEKVWWSCPKGDDHEWEARIIDRNSGTGCPICSGNKVVRSTSFGALDPEQAKLWHPTKNGELTPYDVSTGSTKRVWFKCPKGDDHEWESTVSKRKVRRNCPICTGQKVVKSNCLATLNPELAKEWHPTKNGDLTPFDVPPGTHRKVWWKCPKGDDHEYQSQVANRNAGRGCPICRGLKVVKSNSLATLNPELAKEWHPRMNGKLTPDDVSAVSGKMAWWKCPKGDDHVWKSTISNRHTGQGCSICSGKTIVKSNSLATLNPQLAEEWHLTKNGRLTPNDVTLVSGKKVWWCCLKNREHEWKAQISSRKISGCPFCTLTPQSRQELIITFELLTIFKEINPKGFKKRIDGSLYSIDIFIPSINIGIEFDGAYWHKDNQLKDKQKTLNIEETGLNLIRVRQKPLKRLFDDDVMAEKKFDGKQITNDILKQIVKDNSKFAYTLNKRTLTKIDNYMSKEGLQNEKALDKYIDMILEEKAERKRG